MLIQKRNATSLVLSHCLRRHELEALVEWIIKVRAPHGRPDHPPNRVVAARAHFLDGVRRSLCALSLPFSLLFTLLLAHC